MLIDGHLEIQASELAQMAMSEGVLCPAGQQKKPQVQGGGRGRVRQGNKQSMLKQLESGVDLAGGKCACPKCYSARWQHELCATCMLLLLNLETRELAHQEDNDKLPEEVGKPAAKVGLCTLAKPVHLCSAQTVKPYGSAPATHPHPHAAWRRQVGWAQLRLPEDWANLKHLFLVSHDGHLLVELG